MWGNVAENGKMDFARWVVWEVHSSSSLLIASHREGFPHSREVIYYRVV
jgi:hypothetical protein